MTTAPNRRNFLYLKTSFCLCTALLLCAPSAQAAPPNAQSQASNSPSLSNSTTSHMLFTQKRYKACIEAATREIAADPNNKKAYNCRGQSYYFLEDPKNAVLDLDRYFPLTTGVGDVGARRVRGLCLCQLGRLKDALKDFDICVKAQPGIWDFWQDRANTYAELGQYDKAISDAGTMIKLKPDAPRYSLRARMYMAAGKYQLAIADWNKAISDCPQNPVYYGSRAQCYDKAGKKDLAAADKKKRDELSRYEF